MLFMGPRECAFSLRCLAKLDVWLLFQKANLCSLYSTLKCLAVYPTYAILQSGQVSLYTPDNENLSGVGVDMCEQVPHIVVWAECNFEVSLSKHVSDVGGFCTYVGEGDPLFLRRFGHLLLPWCVDGRFLSFLRFDGERIVVKDIVDDV
jgi:hypothetical protein